MDGDRYILPDGASCAASLGFVLGSLVAYLDGLWFAYVLATGWIAYVRDQAGIFVFDARNWGGPRRMGINGEPDDIPIGSPCTLMWSCSRMTAEHPTRAVSS